MGVGGAVVLVVVGGAIEVVGAVKTVVDEPTQSVPPPEFIEEDAQRMTSPSGTVTVYGNGLVSVVDGPTQEVSP